MVKLEGEPLDLKVCHLCGDLSRPDCGMAKILSRNVVGNQMPPTCQTQREAKCQPPVS